MDSSDDLIFSLFPWMMGSMKLLTAVLFLFILLLDGAHCRQALTSYYHYDGKPIFLRKDSFRRYVLPQLRGMTRDWERLLVRLNPLHEDLVALRRRGEELSVVWEKAGGACRKEFSQDCYKTYQKAYVLGRKIDSMGLIFWEKNIVFQSPGKKKGGADRAMELFVHLGKILDTNYLILHYLEEGMILGGDGRNPHGGLASVMEPLIKDLKFFSNAAMTGFLPKEERKMFDFVWDNFFSPLDTYVVKKRDKEYLLRHLEELNIAWHTFHMKLTKGFKKYPQNVKVFFTTMNKRWNSILKIILHTKNPDVR